MLKKLLPNILITTIIILGVGGMVAIPKTAHAACNIGGVVTGNGLTDCVNEVAVMVVMPLTGKFLQLSAYLFDQALTLNMNIARFLQKPGPACQGKDCLISPVEVIWKLIRDLSGMFFIFVLIWASIKMILGGENSKNVIVGVVIAGLLVNFSLFATKVVIDASNAFTLTIYNAISPGQANVGLIDSTGGGMFNMSEKNNLYGKDGTVSSKIMQVVDLQSLFATTQNATKKTNFNVTAIVTVMGGAALMLVLGLAFLAAGLMFLWRFVMLLTLMAFSPIPALAYAFPSLNKYSSKFVESLINQAFFAPIFLFFIYIALRVLTNDAFVSIIGTKNNSFANVFGTAGTVATPLIQYGLVIFVIFTGLITAKSFGAKGAEWGMSNITGLGKWTGGVIGRNTAGRMAKGANNVLDWASTKQIGKPDGNFAKTGNMLAKFPLFSIPTKEGTKALRSGLKNISSSKFGSSQSLDDIEKKDKEYTKKQQGLGRERTNSKDIQTHLDSTASTSHADLKKVLSKLTAKDVEGLGKDIYIPKLAAQLTSNQVSAILKSDELTESDKDKFKKARTEGVVEQAEKFKYSDIESILKEDLSDDQKKSIEDARVNKITTILASGTADEAKNTMKNAHGKELAKMIDAVPYTPGATFSPNLIDNIKISHLKEMTGLSQPWRKALGDQISALASHDAKGWINDNAQRGTWRT